MDESAVGIGSAQHPILHGTLFLLFCCCHPNLAPASQVAMTLRAVVALITREIADGFYVPLVISDAE